MRVFYDDWRHFLFFLTSFPGLCGLYINGSYGSDLRQVFHGFQSDFDLIVIRFMFIWMLSRFELMCCSNWCSLDFKIPNGLHGASK